MTLEQLKKEFPHGQVVYLTPEARTLFPMSPIDRKLIVVGYGRKHTQCLQVCWEDKIHPHSLSYTYVTKIPPTQ